MENDPTPEETVRKEPPLFYPGTGLFVGHAHDALTRIGVEVDLQPTEPDVSTSPYHTPYKDMGEQRFLTQRDVDEELAIPPLRARNHAVNESFRRTLETAPEAEDIEVRPVLLGIRKAITRKRLRDTERGIKRLEEVKLVSEDIGRNVTRKVRKPDGSEEWQMSSGFVKYSAQTNPLRPRGFRQKMRAFIIDELNEHAQRLGGKKNYMRTSFGPDIGSDQYHARMKQRPIGLGEKLKHRKFDASARGTNNVHGPVLRLRDRLIEGPTRRQDKLLKQRGKLEAKMRAYESARR